MRVSDRMTARNYLKYLDHAKTNYAKTNERIASGNRFIRISDDVSAGTRVLRVRGDMTKSEEYYDNVKSINEQMSSTENAIMSINDILGVVHSKKIVRALDATAGESGRTAIANEIAAMKKEILQFANSKYNTQFVLGGSTAKTPPFSLDKDGKMLYNGIAVDDIQKDLNGYFYMDGTDRKNIPMDDPIFADIGLGIRMQGSDLESDTAFQVSYSGLDILGFGKNADGTPQNVYNLLDDIEGFIRENDIDNLRKYDDQLLIGIDKFTANLTDIGAKTNFLDTVQHRIEKDIDSYKTQLNTLMGINDAEEAMNQTMNDFVLKAVLQMGSNILPMSLLDYLR